MALSRLELTDAEVADNSEDTLETTSELSELAIVPDGVGSVFWERTRPAKVTRRMLKCMMDVDENRAETASSSRIPQASSYSLI